MKPILVIANKNYSSWSFRPWFLMRHFGLAFDEIVIPMAQENTHAEMLRFSPAGKCPSLHDGGIIVWDSLAIIEYVAELYPRTAIWPRPRAARAQARSLAKPAASFVKLAPFSSAIFRRPTRCSRRWSIVCMSMT